MSYHYEVLEEVLISVGKDFSDENIYTQLQRLSSDEMAKLMSLRRLKHVEVLIHLVLATIGRMHYDLRSVPHVVMECW